MSRTRNGTIRLIGMRGGRRSPAMRLLNDRQLTTLLVLVVAFAIGFVREPRITVTVLISLSTIGYACLLGFKAWLVQSSWSRVQRDRLTSAIPSAPTARLADEDLPPYTVLVPLFREGAVVAPLVSYLAELDYPAHKLEVLLLCEEDDGDTLDVVDRLDLPFNVRVVRCPPGHPRTKPRACNIGLAQARGRYVVIYDAEDRPELDQLRLAAAQFAATDERTICLQARLDYHNNDHNLLTRFFTLEYNFWFDLLLPALVRRDLPIPLGGTSNHFRARALIELGGWDPYNVTEDADLGLRLYAAGYRTEMVDSVTFEEACARVRPWIKQRSRWLKGYLQTWAVGSRSGAVRRRGGWRGAAAMHLLLGGTPIINLVNPVFWAANIYYAVTRDQRMLALFPRPVLYAAVLVFLAGNFLFVYTNFLGMVHRERWHLLVASLLSPVYWLLMSISAARAAWQLVGRLHVWEKTPHGLTGAATDPAMALSGASRVA